MKRDRGRRFSLLLRWRVSSPNRRTGLRTGPYPQQRPLSVGNKGKRDGRDRLAQLTCYQWPLVSKSRHQRCLVGRKVAGGCSAV